MVACFPPFRVSDCTRQSRRHARVHSSVPNTTKKNDWRLDRLVKSDFRIILCPFSEGDARKAGNSFHLVVSSCFPRSETNGDIPSVQLPLPRRRRCRVRWLSLRAATETCMSHLRVFCVVVAVFFSYIPPPKDRHNGQGRSPRQHCAVERSWSLPVCAHRKVSSTALGTPATTVVPPRRNPPLMELAGAVPCPPIVGGIFLLFPRIEPNACTCRDLF